MPADNEPASRVLYFRLHVEQRDLYFPAGWEILNLVHFRQSGHWDFCLHFLQTQSPVPLIQVVPSHSWHRSQSIGLNVLDARRLPALQVVQVVQEADGHCSCLDGLPFKLLESEVFVGEA